MRRLRSILISSRRVAVEMRLFIWIPPGQREIFHKATVLLSTTVLVLRHRGNNLTSDQQGERPWQEQGRSRRQGRQRRRLRRREACRWSHGIGNREGLESGRPGNSRAPAEARTAADPRRGDSRNLAPVQESSRRKTSSRRSGGYSGGGFVDSVHLRIRPHASPGVDARQARGLREYRRFQRDPGTHDEIAGAQKARQPPAERHRRQAMGCPGLLRRWQ